MTRFKDRQRTTANSRFQPPPQIINGTLNEIKLDTASDRKLANILYKQDRGHLHEYFGQKFGVQFDVQSGGDTLKFYGDAENASRVKRAFAMLSGMVESGTYIDKSAISSIAAQVNPPPGAARAFKSAANSNTAPSHHDGGSVKGEFKALNETQQKLAETIDNNDLIFAVGPAGTGKTHIAVVKAITALKEGKVEKILLARPAAESGEKIGYLPGDANAKLAPYMRPIYDELDKAFGAGAYKAMLEKGTIEIAPISYMRGRTFDNAFVILDEAQNTTQETIKMAITRLGKNSKMVITGDPQQIDLPRKEDSGLIWASEIMEGKKGAAKIVFEQGDVVRSEIVQTFVSAVEEWEVATGKKQPKAAPVVTDDLPPPPKPQGNQGPSNPRY